MKMDGENNDQIRSEIHRLTSEARQAKTSKEAVQLYEDAYKKSRQLDEDKLERICALNLGAAHIEDNNPKTGLEYLHKATPPTGTERDDAQSNGDLNFNKAFANEKLGKHEEALELYERARDDYMLENNGAMGKQCYLKMAQMLCDMAAQSRTDPKLTDKAEDVADRCLKLKLHEMGLEKSECIDASKILNELGLLYTQLQSYDKATQCFEKAVELCRQGGPDQNQQLMAVLLQNLGAGYNFQGDYQRSIKFHEDAEKKYTKIGNYRIGRNGQGQCFMNLAYAFCQLEGGASERAFMAFSEAKKAAEDTDDRHMLWQAYEGQGAVSFNQGNYSESAEKYREAIQRIADPDNSKRVADKLEIALQYKMAQRSGRVPTTFAVRPNMPVQQLQPMQAQQMQSTLNGGQEQQIIAVPQGLVQAQVPAAEQNMMSSLKMQPILEKKSRGKVRVRKHDSMGPHFPKVALGFGTLSRPPSVMMVNTGVMVDSPRYQGVTSGLETGEVTEEEEKETEIEDSGTSSSEEEEDSDSEESVNSPKVKEIFRRDRASTSGMSPAVGGTVTDNSLKKYANMLEEKEADEADKDEDSEEEDSDEDDSDESSEEDTDVTETPQNKSYSDRHNGYHGDSPRANTSDTEPPYATIGTIKRNGEDTSAGSGGFRMVKNEQSGTSSDADNNDGNLENLPRGQRENILHEQHLRRQREEADKPPTLPDRKDTKSKACVIM